MQSKIQILTIYIINDIFLFDINRYCNTFIVNLLVLIKWLYFIFVDSKIAYDTYYRGEQFGRRNIRCFSATNCFRIRVVCSVCAGSSSTTYVPPHTDVKGQMNKSHLFFSPLWAPHRGSENKRFVDLIFKCRVRDHIVVEFFNVVEHHGASGMSENPR